MNVDLRQLARELNRPLDHIQRALQLLDEGNTVPFVTRYRKDQTGGLDEEQIRRIQSDVARMRMLAERKQTILKSIESQGKLTPELASEIEKTQSVKRLEDLYLPFKPKKQTLATIARQQGLGEFSEQVLNGAEAIEELESHAAEFIAPEAGLASAGDVLAGVGHILAERFSENAELRGRLRKMVRNSGKLRSVRIESAPAGDKIQQKADQTDPAHKDPAQKVADQESKDTDTKQHSAELQAPEPAVTPPTDPPPALNDKQSAAPAVHAADQSPADQAATPENPPAVATTSDAADSAQPASNDGTASADSAPQESAASSQDAPASPNTEASAEPAAASASEGEPALAVGATQAASAEPPSAANTAAVSTAAPAEGGDPTAESAAASPGLKKVVASVKKKKKKKSAKGNREKIEAAYKDYFDYREQLSRIPPHRVLAINRGERAKFLRVRIEIDFDALLRQAEEFLVSSEHRHAEFLRACVRDALLRLVLPSLEREIRREMTEKAEQHAVEVFARNLRKLLLQPPVRSRRVLAIDPGFKSGCKFAALDEFGNVLGSGVFHVVGSEDRRKKGRQRLADVVKEHDLSVIAIGNGTACRETEQLAADIIANELPGRDVAYVVANEAGASVYSTSALGREELPQFDPVVRSAISIGRRLLDPLSELVKINPANIGVGMYQHDVKAKHLRDSLDAVVESCVNYVGVDVNTASPALLRYVSGLNQLTARRLYDHRREHGPFENREQLKQAPGFGEATFVQSAGFLKIVGGDNPLDATWIHPESYEVARRVLEKLDSSVEELERKVGKAAASEVTATPAEAEPEPATALEGAESATCEAESPKQPAPDSGQAPGEAPPQAETSQPANTVETTAEPNAAADPDAPAASEPGPETAANADSPASTSVADPAAEEDSPPAAAPPDDTASDASSAATAEASASSTAATQSPPEAAGSADSPADAPANPPAVGQNAKPNDSERGNGAAPFLETLSKRAAQLDIEKAAGDLQIGALLLKDMLSGLARPGRDPRDDLPPPVFRRGIMKLEDLEPGMELAGAVLNVVDFGAFVDIGLSDSGLVHISRLADRYIRDPHEVVGVGDVLKVWVVEVDKQRRRVSLTAIKPGTEKTPAARREKSHPRKKSEKPPRQAKGGRRADRGGKRMQPPKHRKSFASKPKPKAVKPITKAMEEGREPMRSFSDLMQFMEKKDDPQESENGKS